MKANPRPASRSRSAADLTQTVLAIFRLNGTLLAWGDRFAAREGLTSARWQMLGAIALDVAPLTAPAIAAAMGVTRQGAQRQLNLLVEDGLVESAANPSHQRSPHYRLTARGRAAYTKLDARWNAHAAELASGVSAGDFAATGRVLGAVQARLTEEMERIR